MRSRELELALNTLFKDGHYEGWTAKCEVTEWILERRMTGRERDGSSGYALERKAKEKDDWKI